MPTSRTGRLLAAACLLLTGIAEVVSIALLPTNGDPGDRKTIDAFAAHAGHADGALTAGVFTVLLGASIALAALLARPRAPRLAAVAGWLGIVASSAMMVLTSTDYIVKAAAETDHAAGAALLKKATSVPQGQPFVVIGLLGSLVAFVCLGIALWRSRAVPRWAAVALVAYMPLTGVTANASPGVFTISAVLLLIGFGACAVAILRNGLPALAAPAAESAPMPAQRSGQPAPIG